MPGYISSTSAPRLQTCHDGTYLWVTSTSSYDIGDAIPTCVRLDDQIANVDGKLVYYSPLVRPAHHRSSSSSSSSSFGSNLSEEHEHEWGRERGEFSERAVSVALSPCGSRLIAVLPRKSGQEPVKSELDLDMILSCEDGEFSWV